MLDSASDPTVVTRLARALVPISAAQVALAIVTAIVVPGLAVSSSAKSGLIAAEAVLAGGLVALFVALRRRSRELALAAQVVPTNRNGGRQ